jgi:Zn-dependent protease/CBS domain-containing protein
VAVGQNLRLGRVAGIQVGANWSVAVILVIIAEILAVSVLPADVPHRSAALYWFVAVFAAALFLASLLAHELAHAVVARRHGVGVRSITLWMLGGVAELEGDPPSAAADLLIALAGPAASLIAGGVFLAAGAVIDYARGPAVAVAAAGWLALMNGVLAAFNMLPGAPLDGGRVLRAMLWRRYRDRLRAERAAARAGRFLGAAIIGLGAAELLGLGSYEGLWLMLIGWFLFSAAGAEESAARAAAALAGVRVADIMTPHPDLAPAWSTVGDFIDRVAAQSRQGAFPVVDLGGRLSGLVVADQLARVPAQARHELHISQVALAVPAGYLAAPDDPAAPLLNRRPLGGAVAAVVLAEDHVVGLVTMADLGQALRWRGLARAASSDTAS